MNRVAAFFDLDRTILADSSALLLTEAFADVGLIPAGQVPMARIAKRIFRVVGETSAGMIATRKSMERLAGWVVTDVEEAVEKSIDKLVASIHPQATDLIRAHQDQGHRVVVATSTGHEFIDAICKHLGVDDVIATEYEKADGAFTGRTVGEWIWGPDKAKAVERYATEHDIDLSESFAYSDSYYDRHMFEIVGFPRPVNPDAMLRALAVRRGWPVLSFGGGAAAALSSFELYDLLRPLANPMFSPINLDVEGIENIPLTGPVILAANHRSYLDPVALAIVASRAGRKLRYLGKKEVFDAPVIGNFARAMRQIRVERGTGDATPVKQAVDALGRGEAIGIFPQGTIPRGRAFFEPKLHGKSGVVRLAVDANASVVPVAMWGQEKIWPRSSRVPDFTKLATRARVNVVVGKPMRFSGDCDDRDWLNGEVERVMEAISELIPAEVRNRKPESDAEIDLATPANITLTDSVPFGADDTPVGEIRGNGNNERGENNVGG